jgi:hypothetical protein
MPPRGRTAERRVEHVAGELELDPPRAEVGGQALARERHQRRRQVDRHHVGAAPRASTASAPVPQPASSMRGRAGRPAASRAAWRACGRGRRAPWRGCGRPARPRSAAPRPARPCGRSRLDLAAALLVRRRHGPPSDISRIPAGRRCRGPSSARRSAGRAQPTARGQAHVFASAPPRARASRSISNSVDFFRRLRGSRRGRGSAPAASGRSSR